MLMRVYIDFNLIPAEHADIDRRLINWGRWCHPFDPPAVAPGFELYRSSARARESTESRDSVDGSDAVKLHSLVQTLPTPQRIAVTWAYSKPTAPGKQARKQDVTLEQLHFLLRDARERLITQSVAAIGKLRREN